MAKPSFAELKANIGKKSSGEENNNRGNYGDVYPFWDMGANEEAIIRFLPDGNEDNPEGYFIEKLVHKLQINGQVRNVPCQKMYGRKHCPACDISAEYYKAGDDDNGKKFYRNKVHVARAVIVSDPIKTDEQNSEGKIKTINLSYQVYKAMLTSFSDLEDYPYDYNNGCNFVINKQVTKDGKREYANYSFSKFARKETPLSDYINLEDVDIVDLTTLLPSPITDDEMEKLLEAAITGTELDESSDSGNTEHVSGLGAVKNSINSVGGNNSKVNDDSIEDEAESILNDIMNANS